MTNNPVQPWFKNAIISGLQLMLTLSLPRTPASDVISATAGRWSGLLWQQRVWDQKRDEARIAIAFDQLSLNCSEWPSPKDFLTFLPAREAQPALPPPPLSGAARAKARSTLQSMISEVDAQIDRRSAFGQILTDPFRASGAVSVTDRIDSVKRMNMQQLEQALKTTNLQSTVTKAIHARIRKLQKEVLSHDHS